MWIDEVETVGRETSHGRPARRGPASIGTVVGAGIHNDDLLLGWEQGARSNPGRRARRCVRTASVSRRRRGPSDRNPCLGQPRDVVRPRRSAAGDACPRRWRAPRSPVGRKRPLRRSRFARREARTTLRRGAAPSARQLLRAIDLIAITATSSAVVISIRASKLRRKSASRARRSCMASGRCRTGIAARSRWTTTRGPCPVIPIPRARPSFARPNRAFERATRAVTPSSSSRLPTACSWIRSTRSVRRRSSERRMLS